MYPIYLSYLWLYCCAGPGCLAYLFNLCLLTFLCPTAGPSYPTDFRIICVVSHSLYWFKSCTQLTYCSLFMLVLLQVLYLSVNPILHCWRPLVPCSWSLSFGLVNPNMHCCRSCAQLTSHMVLNFGESLLLPLNIMHIFTGMRSSWRQL